MMKKNQKRRSLCILAALLTCVVCFIGQWACYHCLRQLNARFVSPVGEENTLIRLQSVRTVEAPVIFMGSSLTERLLSGKSCASIAIPGSSFVHVNEYMKPRYRYSEGTVYVLEVNNMFNNRNNSLMARLNRWDFDFFCTSSHFSFAAKPINLLTSTIFYVMDRGAYRTSGCFDSAAPLVCMEEVPDITDGQKKEWALLIAGVAEIRARGGRVCFVCHPSKITGEHYRRAFEQACILAKYSGVPVLNYNSSEWVERLEFSDATHLISRKKSTIMYRNTVARDAAIIAVK